MRALRLERNLTQEQLAEQIGTTKVNVSRWERGEIVPGLYYRQKLCELFEKSPYELGFLAEDEPLTSENISGNNGDLQMKITSSPSSIIGPPGPPRVDAVQRFSQSSYSWAKKRYRLVLIGIMAIVIVGRGLISLNNRPTSSLHAGSLLYTLHIPQAADDVEWSQDASHLVCVIENQSAQLIATGKGAYLPTTTIRAYNVATWSPDSTRIASANKDRTVRIWSSRDGSQLTQYDGPTETVSGLAWSPDGKYLAAGDGAGVLWIWDVQTNKLVYSAHIHADRIWWVAWSPDGKRIATASVDKTVQIWDMNSQTIILTLIGHTNEVFEVMWSPDGKYLASSSKDTTVRVWDAVSGKTINTYYGHTDQVMAAVWSPDGSRIASSSFDGTVQIWDAITGQTIFTYKGHSGRVFAVSWSRDHRIASGSQDGTLQVWQAP